MLRSSTYPNVIYVCTQTLYFGSLYSNAFRPSTWYIWWLFPYWFCTIIIILLHYYLRKRARMRPSNYSGLSSSRYILVVGTRNERARALREIHVVVRHIIIIIVVQGFYIRERLSLFWQYTHVVVFYTYTLILAFVVLLSETSGFYALHVQNIHSVGRLKNIINSFSSI